MKQILIYIVLLLLCLAPLPAKRLYVYDVDPSGFPVVRAKFFAMSDTVGVQMTDFAPEDILVTEAGEEREVLSVTCPEQDSLPPLSIVITAETSLVASRNGDSSVTARALKEFITGIDFSISECALTSYNVRNYINCDFINRAGPIRQAVDEMQTAANASIDLALLKPHFGAIPLISGRQGKKVILLIANDENDCSAEEIISKARAEEISIFCFVPAASCPPKLKRIAEETGGHAFYGKYSLTEATNIMLMILKMVQGYKPCEIEWHGQPNCKLSNVNVKLAIDELRGHYWLDYEIPEKKRLKLDIEPYAMKFLYSVPGNHYDTTITFTATNGDFNITDIIVSNPAFTLSSTSFTLAEGQAKEISMTFSPIDSGYVYSDFEVVSDKCDLEFMASGGFPGRIPAVKTMRLTHPDSSEVLVAGADTVITWEGLLPTEKVLIEYSIDNGKNWSTITNTASGNSYKWKVPTTISNECLIRLTANSRYVDCGEVTIGYQTWMKCNLNVTRYRNGDTIRACHSEEQWRDARDKGEGAWCYPAFNPSNGIIYGKLYNFYAVEDERGLAPEGWRVPSDRDWGKLEMFLGMPAEDRWSFGLRGTTEGGRLKSTNEHFWALPNVGATDEFGFGALPGGSIQDFGRYGHLGEGTVFWTTDVEIEEDLLHNTIRIFYFDSSKISRTHNTSYTNHPYPTFLKGFGASVRCIKDE